MLIHYLHIAPADAKLWIVVVAVNLLASLCVGYNGIQRTHRTFSLYLYFSLLTNIVLMSIPVGNGFAIYTWVSVSIDMVLCLLQAICVADLYRRVFGPKISLPARVPRDLRLWLAIATALSGVIGLVFWPRYGSQGYRALMAIQSAAGIVLALALLILIFYGARIGHYLRSTSAQIAIGFVLMLSINAISLPVVMAGPRVFTFPAQRAGQFFGILAFGWWSWKFSKRQPVRVRPSPESVAEVKNYTLRETAALAVFQARKVLKGQSEVPVR